MKKYDRRVAHELANALGLKSQSRGSGYARYPVLYKTARTPNFNGKHSIKLDKILAQPRFNRQSSRMTSNPKSNFRESEPKASANRRRPNTAASYLEGEVVGGSAPEIGANNKGRAMLEKMGWSTGTALGALNNKGILQPVAQVVKNTRAGLG
jgi:G-patch domain/R3H domain